MKTRERTDLCTHLHHDSSSNDVAHCTKVKVIFHFKVKVIFVRADGLQELGDVVGVQGAGLRGHAAGEVCVAYVSDALNEQKRSQKGLFVRSHSSQDKSQSKARLRFEILYLYKYIHRLTNKYTFQKEL